jgi:hypothetical protein
MQKRARTEILAHFGKNPPLSAMPPMFWDVIEVNAHGGMHE